MKIAFLITKSNWGGAQKYVYELATGLDKEKYNVKVIAGGNGALIQRLNDAGIYVISLESLSNETGFKKELRTLRDLWSIIRNERPDVLHINSSKAGIMGALVGRILRVPKVIFTAHGWAFNEDRPWHQKLILKIMHWMTIVMAHQTIAVSNNIAGAFEKWPLIQGKIKVIHNGIKPATPYGKSGARQALATEFPQLKEVFQKSHLFVVGTIAELHPIKNISSALLGMKEIIDGSEKPADKNSPDFVYLVMGEGRERERLEKMMVKLGLSNNVYLLGHVPDAAQYVKAFDAFLLPSKSEALAYVILEAGLQETPVIATAVGGIPEIVEDMKSGVLIQSNKPREIAHAIRFFSEHPDMARQYAKNLNENIRKNFTLERMIGETEGIYNK